MSKKIIALLISSMIVVSVGTGCGNQTAENPASTAVQQEIQSEAKQSTDASTGKITEDTKAADNVQNDQQVEAEKLLEDLTGTYQELWPVILADDYHQVWIDDSAALVGAENAEAAVEKMQSMVSGTLYGEEAVEAYKDGDGMAYFCGFTEGVNQFQFDGNTIKGLDSDGKEVFSHTYEYVGMEETRGLYEYKSDDEDAGEFTYFCLAPDTSDTTYHIEFRYGSDLEALSLYDAGNYAYWLASGISADCDQTMIENSINLFCTENLSESR